MRCLNCGASSTVDHVPSYQKSLKRPWRNWLRRLKSSIPRSLAVEKLKAELQPELTAGKAIQLWVANELKGSYWKIPSGFGGHAILKLGGIVERKSVRDGLTPVFIACSSAEVSYTMQGGVAFSEVRNNNSVELSYLLQSGERATKSDFEAAVKSITKSN